MSVCFLNLSLSLVSEHFLNEQKEDVHYSIISDLFRGTADDRVRKLNQFFLFGFSPLGKIDDFFNKKNYMYI